MSKKHDQLLGHADDNDGIDEYDNPLPDWWLGLFFFTIVYGVGYAVYFHVIAEDSQEKRYEAQMAAAAELYPEMEAPDTLSYDEATLAAGAEVFATTCAVCHLADLTGQSNGGIGPNLIDDEWKYGNTEQAVLTSIMEGRPGGMPPWKQSLSPEAIAQVAAFVLSKSGGPGTMEDPTATATPEPAPEGAATDAPPATEDAPASDGNVDGQAVFGTYCVACHNTDLTGLVGPNLVDDEWLHGGSLEEITATITNGVEGTAMVAWSATLSAEQIDAVARYVHDKAHE